MSVSSYSLFCLCVWEKLPSPELPHVGSFRFHHILQEDLDLLFRLVGIFSLYTNKKFLQEISVNISHLAFSGNFWCQYFAFSGKFWRLLHVIAQQVTMQALLCQESHQELADRTGKSVLELDAGLGRPRVVAYPAPEAALLGLGQPYDPMGVLKPHLRRHNQKTIRSVKERNPDLVKNTYENNAEWIKIFWASGCMLFLSCRKFSIAQLLNWW